MKTKDSNFLKLLTIMKKYFIALIIAVIFFACKKQEKSDNPFFSQYETPFGVPPFDKIKNSHYIPAFLKGNEEQNKKIRDIISNPAEPTFENTIKPFIFCHELLDKVRSVLDLLSLVNTNDSIDSINREISNVISKHNDEIQMNDTLFRRVKAVYDNRNKFSLTEEENRILKDTFKGFIRKGVALSSKDKERLIEINKELSALVLKFSQNLRSETNAFKLVIDNEKDLSGLPKDVCEQAAATAKSLEMKGKWVFTLEVPVLNSFLQNSDNRNMREKMYKANSMRCDNDNEKDNKKVISRIATLRAEKAQLLGYRTYADYVIEEAMAKTPASVYNFLTLLWDAAIPFVKSEILAEQQMIDKENMKFKLEPWDWRYYAEKLKKEK